MSENYSDEMVFDNVEPMVVPVKFKVDGVYHEYILVDPDRDAIIAYKEKQASGIKLQEGELAGISASEAYESELLGQCLFRLIKDEDTGKKTKAEKPVGTDWVIRMKNRIVEPLIVRLKEISGIKAEEDRLKAEAEARKKQQKEEKELTDSNQARLTSETDSGLKSQEE
jgi:hypothetical protein